MYFDLSLLSEFKRLKELLSYQILDTPKDGEFDFLVKAAAHIFNVPVAAITFMDENRQWIKASVGLNVCEIDRKLTICNHTIRQHTITEIQDLSKDERFRNFPFVAGSPFYRFYAGIPLITPKGYPVGVFCLVDTSTRCLNEEERALLRAFAKNAMTQVEISMRNKVLENINEAQKRISSIISHSVKEPVALSEVIADVEKAQADDAINALNLEELNGLLKKEADNTTGLLNEMIQWRKSELQEAVNNIQNVSFKQTVFKIMKEIKAEGTLM
jgi:GAF domain-containing protein